MKSVSLRDVAAKAGVSVGTVSFSLHGNPMIPEATRRRICRLATEMGYELDPRIAKTMSIIRRRKPKQAPTALAMLLARTPEEADKHDVPRNDVCFQITQARARELGYSIDLFYVGGVTNPVMSPSRLQVILETRAICGVLLPPVGVHPPVIPADLSKFSFIEGMDRGLPPFFSGVEPAVFQNTMIAMRELHALGHRRVAVFLGGLLFVPEILAAYRHFAIEHGWPLLEPYHRIDYNSDDVPAWLAREKPTAVYSNYFGFHTHLESLGLTVPGDMSLAVTEVPHHSLKVDPSGIDDQPDLMFSIMVEMLVEQLNDGICGIPKVRRRLELLGTWHPGSTLAPIDPQAARSAGWMAFLRRQTGKKKTPRKE